MRWDELEEWLGEVVTVPRVYRDHYLQPKDAINLNDILMFIVETEEERARLKDEWIVSPSMFCCPVGAENLIGTQYPVLPLLEFTWEGMLSWISYLRILEMTERDYVCLFIEEQPYRLLAGMDKYAGEEEYSSLIEDLLSFNGLTFGVEMFGSLPTMTVNSRPDLVPAEALRKAYYRWMEYVRASTGGIPWTSLGAEMLREGKEDHPLRQFRAVVEELTSGGLEARKENEKKLTDKGKGFIMDMYFEQCYGE